MQFLEYILYTFSACVVIFLVPGPLFFLSINEGAQGVKRGFYVLAGIVAGEVILLAAMFVGFAVVFKEYMFFLKLLGSFILVWLAISAWTKASKQSRNTNVQNLDNPMLKGFMLTFLNPPFIIWLTSVGAAILEKGLSNVGEIAYGVFASVMLLSTLLVTGLLVILAHSGRSMLGPKSSTVLAITAGTAFMIFAALLLLDLLQL